MDDYYVSHQTLTGQEAPDFTADAVMPDGSMGKLTLSDNWKNDKYTVLFFYPFDFTFVCPTEIIAFSDAVAEFKKRNVELVSVSLDSKFVHAAWRNTPRSEGGIGDIQYPMVADVTHEIMNDYGVQSPNGAAFRGLFLIDNNGNIRHSLVNDLPLGRSVEETLRMVDALQFHEEHGEVCPANWKPGADGINTAKAGEYFAKVNA